MRNFISCFLIANCANLFLNISEADNKESVSYDGYKHQELNASNESIMGYLYYRLPVQGYYTKYHENLLSMFEKVQESSSERNICPFEWKENIQENRLPRILLTVVCKNMIYEKGEKSYNCQPVSYIMPVLIIQSCHYGLPVYKQHWENITVSCIPKFSATTGSKVVISSFYTNSSGYIVERESQTTSSIEDPI